MAGKNNLGRVGIWSMAARFAPDGGGITLARELEQLGFGALWIPGGIDDGVLASMDILLDATQTITIASGILNIWKHEPADVAAWFAGQSADRQARIMLGLGVSHGPIIGENWGKPVAKMRSFCEGLTAAGMTMDHICLAALGPKMLELSAQASAGAHPYLVTPRHTALARQIMGGEALLAPEQGVILESDPAKAREYARAAVGHYARLPNYVNNWLRDGFTQGDVDSLSDGLIDGLFAWGGVAAIKLRLDEHFAAGADHVCMQVVGETARGMDIALEIADCRKLAELLY